MLPLYIIAGIILLTVIMLFSNLRIYLEIGDNYSHKIKFLFITIHRSKAEQEKEKPGKPKKEKPKKEKSKKPKKDYLAKYKGKGLQGILDLIQDFSGPVLKILKQTKKDLRVAKFILRLNIKGEDAADTARKYGIACSVVYPGIVILQDTIVFKSSSVFINPVFDDSQKGGYYLYTVLKIRIFKLLKTHSGLIMDFVRMAKENNTQNKNEVN